MSPELVALAAGGASALVTAMVTDGWSGAKAGVVALWERYRPGQAQTVEQALESARGELAAADEAARGCLTSTVAGGWRERLEMLLEEHPEAATDLVTLVERLRALAEASGTAPVVQSVHAGRDAYTAGRDQHITQRPDR